MPLIAKDYRVKRGPDNRAIAGLSMGGGESLTIGLDHPDEFAWVAGFSSATPPSGAIRPALENPAALNRKLKLLYIADGKSDFLLQRNEGFTTLLKAHRIHFEWHLTEGCGFRSIRTLIPKYSDSIPGYSDSCRSEATLGMDD